MEKNSYTKKLVYSLKVFDSNYDNDFLKSLEIYRNNIVLQEKTPLNEISWVVENFKKFRTSHPRIFGITLNNTVIGYAEAAYVPRGKFITIDYLILDEKYKTHSAFYTFLLLIIEYFNANKYDYDFIITEKLVKQTSRALIKELDELQLEGFKIINQLYIQPKLEEDNIDSEHEAILLLYQRNTTRPYISKDTYCNIVYSLYFDYYFEWDSFFFVSEEDRINNFNRLTKNYNYIKNSMDSKEIILNGYPFKKLSNDNKIIPKADINKKSWNALIFLITFCIVVLGVVLAIKQLNVEFTIVAIIFILMLFVWLAFISLADDRAMTLIDKIPILSKFFSQSK